jgi:hypothetical protein
MVSQGRIGIDREKDMLRMGCERELVDSAMIESREACEMGAEWCCRQALAQLSMAPFLRGLGRDEDSIRQALALLIIRTAYHSSEYKSLRIMREMSAVCELSGIPAARYNKHKVYDMPLALYRIKQELESRLSDRTSHLFNLQGGIVLFDLTSSYFEGRKEGSRLARHGRSKEKRSDANLAVLALVVNAEGFNIYSSILEGNTSDPSSL